VSKEKGCEDLYWAKLTHDRALWRALVLVVLSFRISLSELANCLV